MENMKLVHRQKLKLCLTHVGDTTLIINFLYVGMETLLHLVQI